jgi:hypothetical protein
MEPPSPTHLWATIHAERAQLAEDLTELDDAQWAKQSLCGTWMGAHFDFDLHNQRRLAEHRGATPTETLNRFRAVIGSRTAPSKHTAAWLGEVIVHGQDIRRPLGLQPTPALDAVTEVARFYAARNFTVPSHSAATGLRLEATDGPFQFGSGPSVSGTTLALTMAMAGRETYCDDLEGEGVSTLRSRCPAG